LPLRHGLALVTTRTVPVRRHLKVSTTVFLKARPRSSTTTRKFATRGDRSQGHPDPVVVLGKTPIEPLLALEAKWRASIAETWEASRQWSAIHDTLPQHAQGGWPRVPHPSPLFVDYPIVANAKPGVSISLRELRELNSHMEKFVKMIGATPQRIAEVRAQGRARVRWWINTYRDGNRISAESGLDDAEAYCEAAGTKLIEIQNQILNARTGTIDGVRIKLAVLLHMATINGYTDSHGNIVKPVEDWDYTDRALYNLHLDAERLAGGAA
jgi:hypothetical protein